MPAAADVSLTRRNHRRAMEQIRSRAPGGDEYPIVFAPTGPEDRGQLGRVRIRTQNGSKSVRDVWWLRCPWCREMVEFPAKRLHVDGGVVHIDGTVVCTHCETIYTIDEGRALRVRGVEGAGPEDVTSEPTTTASS